MQAVNDRRAISGDAFDRGSYDRIGELLLFAFAECIS
ncbi:Uncharacterised protein [Mycobacteroides abscessus subsp. abscessus]|nr:Uncharacterised protein [Mycobacteroides abscessus subsp. abscessus]